MITRQFMRRHARALTRTRLFRPQVLQYRAYAQEAEGIQRSVESSSTEAASVESILQRASLGALPAANARPTQQLDSESARQAENYRIHQHHRETTGGFGALVDKAYRPSDVLNNPPHPSDITPELLLASQAHMGHSTSLWNPMNSKYIYGVREGIHIISLEETAAHLRRACRVVSGVAERGGVILFAGTRRGQDRSIVLAAQMSKAYHLFNKWTPGAITNKEQILGPYKLKMVDENDKEIIVNPEVLKQSPAVMPDLVVCLNPLENWVLLHECALNNIPTIGIIDTDANPTWVTYPIPANDDSLRCTNLIAAVLGRAGEEGQRIRKERTARGDVPYDPFNMSEDNAIGDVYNMRLDADPEHQYEVDYSDENGAPMSRETFEEQERQGVVMDDSMMTVFMDGQRGDARDHNPYFMDEDGEKTEQVSEIRQRLLMQNKGGQAGLPTRSQAQAQIAPREGSDATARPSDAELKNPLALDEKAIANEEKQLDDQQDAERVAAANKVPDNNKQKALNDEKKDKSH